MPELPEVETVAQGLEKRALGRRVAQVEVRHAGVIVGPPDDFAERLSGRTIVAVRRKGKVLVLALDSANGLEPEFVMIRLGMTGQITVQPRPTPLEAHTHVVMALDDGREELRFRDVRRFGNLRILTSGEMEKILTALGPDAREITAEQFSNALRGRHGAIKSWLMKDRKSVV